MINYDLNLLLVFSVIWEERNLSKAAARLYLSQSAVSHSLKRLRNEFQDPLFVRDSRGVAPTEFAQALAPRVQGLLLQVEDIYCTDNSFDPMTSKRKLELASGDYFSITMLEPFISRMTAQAPNIRLSVQPVSSVFHLDKFERGELHLAITAIDVAHKNGFHIKELRRDRIAICVRNDHPLFKRKVTKDQFLKSRHLNVSNFGSEVGVVDNYLAIQGHKRDVTMVVSSFFDAARILRSTDLVLSAPQQICLGLAKEYGLKVCAMPFDFSTRSVSMIWHERTHDDPFHLWVRKLILEL